MAGRIPQSFIDDLIARSDLVDLIREHGINLQKKGRNYSACCPFHHEKTPSFSVQPEKQFYHCFGCKESGNVISFLMKYAGHTFPESIEQLAHRLGVEIPREASAAFTPTHPEQHACLQAVTRFYQDQLRHTPEAIDYLKQRGLSGQIAQYFSLGFAPNRWDAVKAHFGTEQAADLLALGVLTEHPEKKSTYDRFRGRIMFPIRNLKGHVIGFGGRVIDPDHAPKYLNSPETVLYHKGQELYGLYEARKNPTERLIVVEGYMDVVSLAECGLTDVIATLGTAVTGAHIQKALRYCKTLVFCFDGDTAGMEAAWRALVQALPYVSDHKTLLFSFLPEGTDPDDFIQTQGLEAFEAHLEKALSLTGFFLKRLSEEHPPTTLEGKAQLAQAALALLKPMPESLTKELLLKALQDIAPVTLSKKTSTPPPTHPKTTHKRQTLISRTIQLLLQAPKLVHTLPETVAWSTLQQPGVDLLFQLISKARTLETPTTALLLERFREHPHYGHLCQLASTERFSDMDTDAEMAHLVRMLEQRFREQCIDHLLQKSPHLSDEEKQQLNALIRAQQPEGTA